MLSTPQIGHLREEMIYALNYPHYSHEKQEKITCFMDKKGTHVLDIIHMGNL